MKLSDNQSYEDFVLWLDRIGNQSRSVGITAYNLGIFESTDGYVVYLIGSKKFDPHDDDWACNQDYISNECYCITTNIIETIEWQKVLERVASYVDRFVKSTKFQESILALATAITVGFDDGQLVRIK